MVKAGLRGSKRNRGATIMITRRPHHASRAGLLLAGSLLAAVAGQSPALAAGMLTAGNGMTLYTFDTDTGGVSSCYEACAVNWPPYLGKAGETVKGLALVPRKDGKEQWAYQGKPLYFFVGDKKKGDKAGDGKGGVWHVVPQ